MDWQKLYKPIDVVAAPQQPPDLARSQSQPPVSELQPTEIAPGVFDMVASFATSLGKFAAGSFRGVPKEVHDQRLAICNACEHFARGNCLVCGCFITPKTVMPHEVCPIGKWKSAY